MNRPGLLKAHAALTAAIRSGEEWEASYKASPATFKRLLAGEADLQAASTDYLAGLASRVPTIVNWSEAGLKPLQAAAVPGASDEQWKREEQALQAALGDLLLALMVIGGNAGEDIYNVPLGITTLDEAFLAGADRYTASLVSGVTNTTRRQIQVAIKRSVAQGEDIAASIERIRALVASPVRAEMIAQTEAVNAYQSGLDLFGEKSGVKSWDWEALLGACKLCAPLNGVNKKVGELFTLGNGKQVKRPPGHVKCRCGRIANYDK